MTRLFPPAKYVSADITSVTAATTTAAAASPMIWSAADTGPDTKFFNGCRTIQIPPTSATGFARGSFPLLLAYYNRIILDVAVGGAPLSVGVIAEGGVYTPPTGEAGPPDADFWVTPVIAPSLTTVVLEIYKYTPSRAETVRITCGGVATEYYNPPFDFRRNRFYPCIVGRGCSVTVTYNVSTDISCDSEGLTIDATASTGPIGDISTPPSLIPYTNALRLKAATVRVDSPFVLKNVDTTTFLTPSMAPSPAGALIYAVDIGEVMVCGGGYYWKVLGRL